MSEKLLNSNVKIVKLDNPNREVAGTLGFVEDPKIGDIGKVIYEYEAPDTRITVEKSDALAIYWFADFARDEVELVPDGE